jgi:small subunit ribosomal protein S16
MVKLRLRRQGRKGKPFYYIVAADARAPRDGRFIERIGSYNPNTNPATIDLNLDDAVRWLSNGAVPTDTTRAILSYKGALYKHHLNKGVTKGALTQDQADAKFAAWLEEKANRVGVKTDGLAQKAAEEEAAAHKREEEVKEARTIAIAAKTAPEGVVEDATEAAESEVAEATETVDATEVVAEVAEEVVAEVTEEVVAEVAEEIVAEVTEEVVAEVTEEVVAEVTEEVVAEVTEEAAPAEETSEENA